MSNESKERARIRKIRKVLSDLFKDEFPEVRVFDITARPAIDFDDSEVLEIEVVFEGVPNDLKDVRLESAIRLARPQLEKIGESAFPMISYISRKDFEELAGAAA